MGIFPTAVDAVAEAVEERIAPKDPPRRRPPGAVPESRFLTLCTRCDACVDACPHEAVHTYVATAGDLARTPVMRPDRRPCHMCEGFPCAAACETGALVVPETHLVRLGRVRIAEDRCFTFQGPECGACARLCPGGLSALRMRGTRPSIDDSCVGCGICIEACPTTPAAIEILPLPEV